MKKSFNKYFEHTLLKPDTMKKEVVNLFLEALKYDFHAVCVDGCYLPDAWKYLEGSGIMISTVTGFPLGTMDTHSKYGETYEAINDGAEEVDAMMNIGAIKEGRYDYINSEVTVLSKLCHERNVVFKIILETCLLTDDEIIKMCQISQKAGVDFIRTSTGFGSEGATVHAVNLIKDTVGDSVKIKASGGIRTLDHAIELINAGADRLGTSASVYIMEEYIKKGSPEF